MPEPTCPVCDCPAIILLGTLGTLAHYRCQACGAEFSAPAKEE